MKIVKSALPPGAEFIQAIDDDRRVPEIRVGIAVGLKPADIYGANDDLHFVTIGEYRQRVVAAGCPIAHCPVGSSL